MPFKANGPKPPNSGRKKGVTNKATADVREAIATLLQDNVEHMSRWLTEVAADDPGKALDLVVKLAEYHIPKLARSEHSGIDGEPIAIVQAVTDYDKLRARFAQIAAQQAQQSPK